MTNASTGHRPREAGKARIQLVMALAVVVAAATSALFISAPWGANAGVEPAFHGISFLKGCSTTPAVVGDPYSCRFQVINNNDDAPDTLKIQSIFDRIDVNSNGFGDGGDVVSVNLLPGATLTLEFGATCNGGQTECTLPPGGKITTNFISFYNTDADDPNPLTDQATLGWTDTCDSLAINCPVGPQSATTGSQQAVHSPTPTPTNTPTNTHTPTNTPTNTHTPTNTPTNTAIPNTATPVPGGEGCTPGFWKNHADPVRHPGAWPPTPYDPGDDLEDTFGVNLPAAYDNFDLLDGLNARGGGLNALIRHAVAALLNSSHPNIDYDLNELGPGGVIDLFQDAIAAGASEYEMFKNIFASNNEDGCSINGK